MQTVDRHDPEAIRVDERALATAAVSMGSLFATAYLAFLVHLHSTQSRL